jgi:hypothetical protein
VWQKFKHCHGGKTTSLGRGLSLHERNLILINAVHDIFGFAHGRPWTDFKKNISSEQIRELYTVQANLWPPHTDWASIMPRSDDSKLRVLYLGEIRPDLTLENIIRFSLYSDTIFVIDPFLNPNVIRPKYNPIENPNKYKQDTLKLIYFICSVAPWIVSKMLYLIPNPGDLNLDLMWESINLARAGVGDRGFDQRDLEDAHAQGEEDRRRVLMALPDDKLLRYVKRAGMTLTPEEEQTFLAYARQELHNDPLALEQSLDRDGQMVPHRAGANLEIALLICSVTGAFPYTSMHTIWRHIIEARDELSETARVWSPLTKAFQTLDFRFLNNVDPGFAQSLRDDGRLESFRAMLRRIGGGAADVTSSSSLDAFVRDCKDELVDEYRKAQAEWNDIDRSFLKWGATAAGAAAFATGHLLPDLAPWSAATVTTLTRLGFHYLKQQQFRKANPMSVMIDLSRQEPPGQRLF